MYFSVPISHTYIWNEGWVGGRPIILFFPDINSEKNNNTAVMFLKDVLNQTRDVQDLIDFIYLSISFKRLMKFKYM